jgi:Ca-activated chloride channel homolog
MKFLAPQWLWVLAGVPLVLTYIFFDERSRRKRFAAFAHESLWGALVPEAAWNARFRKAVLLLSSFAFLLLAMARPQWGTHEEVARMAGLDVVVALDVSNSMETEDVVPSRLKKAKHLVRNIVDHLSGDRVGLIAFAGSAYLACPLTTDLEYVLDSLSIQTPRIITNQGTDISLALETAYMALDRGSEEQSSHNEQVPLPSRVVILITDGEDHEGGADEMAAKFKAAGIKLFIFGVGTQKGGPVPLRDDSGQLQGYKRDSRGQPVVSSFRPNEMLRLAGEAGGRYWNASDTESEVTTLLQDLGSLGRGEFAEHRYQIFEERFQIPLVIAVLLLLLEMTLPTRRKLRAKKAASPRTKPRLAVVWWILPAALASTVLLSRPAAAGPVDSVDTYVENKKGIEAYQAGQLDVARGHFGAAQAREPSRPELFYNEGLVELEGGHADEAIRSFGQAAQGAMTANKPEILSKSLFNLGSAFGKKGDTHNAVRSYMAAIETARKTGDKKLEEDARKNIELMAQQQQQQKQNKKDQKQQQGQQQQNPDQKDQKDQKDKQKDKNDQQGQKDQQDQDKKDDQGQNKDQNKDDEKKDGQNQPPHYADTQRGEHFNSKKLNSDDAERVFSELKNRELDLQVRQRKQNANRNNNHEDW